MMKLLTFLVVVGLIGAGAYWVYTEVLLTEEQRTCGKLADLCGVAEKADDDQCAQGMEKLRQNIGEKAYEKATDCVDRAESCLTAMGCVAGGGLRGVGQFLEGMFDGVGKDLKDKGKEVMEKLRKKLDESKR